MRYLFVCLLLLLSACKTDQVPVEQVSEPLFTAVSAGHYHVCANMRGRVKCWGHNEYGQLGLGHTNNMGDDPGEIVYLPYVDLGTTEPATQVSVGGWHTCVLFGNGRIKCFGQGWEGATGSELDGADTGTRMEHMGTNLPWIDLGTVNGQPILAIEISSGGSHTCALTTDHRVKCWGQNFFGQLGQGDRRNRGVHAYQMGDNLPYVDVGEPVVQIRAGDAHNCAITESRRLKCWGSSALGQIGLGSRDDIGDQPGEMGTNLPYVDLGMEPREVVPRYEHTCAILVDGSAKCWGDNKFGQLGLGDSANRGDDPGEMGTHLPSIDFGSNLRVLQIDLGYGYTCALLENQRLKCVGYNSEGRMGYDFEGEWGGFWGWHPRDMGDALPYVDLGPIMDDTNIVTRNAVRYFATGDSHTCAIMVYDRIKCFGYAAFGEIASEDQVERGREPGTMGVNLPVTALHW